MVVFSKPRSKFLLIALKLSSKSFPSQLNAVIRERLTSTHDTALGIGKREGTADFHLVLPKLHTLLQDVSQRYPLTARELLSKFS